MRKPELTDWFSHEQKPVIVGVYERDDTGTFMENGRPNYSRWDGEWWLASEDTVEMAAKMSPRAFSEHQDLPWRGLAENPAEK